MTDITINFLIIWIILVTFIISIKQYKRVMRIYKKKTKRVCKDNLIEQLEKIKKEYFSAPGHYNLVQVKRNITELMRESGCVSDFTISEFNNNPKGQSIFFHFPKKLNTILIRLKFDDRVDELDYRLSQLEKG
jgi:hypothetical protein